MGTGDYICVTLRGGAPWGFTLQEGEGDTYRPFLVSQVEEGGHASLAGVQEGDEVVSINGEPCADLTLLRAFALIDTSIDSLQLLVKRYHFVPSEDCGSKRMCCGERTSSGEALESTTLHIFSSKHRSNVSGELYTSESQGESRCGELDTDTEVLRGPDLHLSDTFGGHELVFKKYNEEVRRSFSPGDMVELQVSLSEQNLDDGGCSSLVSARGIEGELSSRDVIETIHTTSITSHYLPCPAKEPLRQRGVVVRSPSSLGQQEGIPQQPAEASGAGRGVLRVGGPEVSDSDGEQCEGAPESFTISFQIPSEEAATGEEQDSDSDEDQEKPNKHRARHARLRRNESLSEKQVKEVKSKCKRIALLLSAAPPNPNNKGVLMFKKHRQRAKKFTLVSYGTGEDEPEFSDEEEEIHGDNIHKTLAGELTFEASANSKSDKPFFSHAPSSKGAITLNLDKSLLEIKRDLNNQAEMESLPDTKGKGALMFAQRRLRMDEISAEHDELRRQGIPVEGVQETEKKVAEHSYMQSATEGHAYMDVNMHQQGQQHYQQYQEQQYYEQQQNYQQQYQQYQQQQYEQREYQQQQMYQNQQEYHPEQQQMQHYSTNINGTVQHQTNEIHSSFSNRTAKPFTAENMVATPYSHAASGTNQDGGQGEQIASRDERISTPAIKTGLLDSRRKTVGKPMFTFKEAPKVSPSPVLLNLLNRSDKKGFESGPEEDYLSLGAEACNFLQSQRVKHKIPPPVAPKPMINPNSFPWSSQIEAANQDMPQCAENSLSTPAAAPTAEIVPALELEPTPAPAPESFTLPAAQETPAITNTAEQPAWTEPEAQQQPPQVTVQEANSQVNSALQSETSQMTWGAVQAQQQPSSCSWQSAQVQPQNPPPRQSSPQVSWATHQPNQNQTHLQHTTSTWTPQSQPSWTQPEEQAQGHVNPQPSWAQPQHPQSQAQVQPPWSHMKEKPHLPQMQPTWGQIQEPMQPQPPNSWTQPSQIDSQQQPPWVHEPQQKAQAQPPWVQRAQPETQSQPPWVQEQHHPDLPQSWPKAQASGQPQPPWVSGQPQQQPSFNAWAPSQTQVQSQPPWIHGAQVQPQVQPQVNLNPWAPVPTQAPSQPSWAQHPPEHGGQQHINTWAQEQNQPQHQPPWGQPVPSQPTPQPNWQQSTLNTSQQPQINMWPPGQVQPQAPGNDWRPQSQQTSLNVPTSTVNIEHVPKSTINIQPSPKPWLSPQNQTPPPPPQRMHSFTIGQKASSPINPMATVLNPKSTPGSAYEMPLVRGKGADMFAKRQSRMEKFVVDSETVEANKASRSTSPAASLPNEWKYTPNVRAPPTRAFNPIQSPFYPPAATKQLPANSPVTKTKKKDQEKKMPAPKPLNVIDVMKHQPYKLDSSLFIFGSGAEAAKPPTPKPSCSPPNPLPDNQPIRYEQMAPVQQTGPFNAPYPQQAYGIPMQPVMQDGQYQQTQAPVYPYQQPPGGPYQQEYNQQYQQPVPPPAYHPQANQSSNLPYQQAVQAAYQPASSPPYLATPSVPYKPQPTSSYIVPNFPVAARPESASGGGTAPKPKFTANKSSAQALGRSYSLSPLARVPVMGQKSACASSSPKPSSRSSITPPARQTSWLEKGFKPLTPWEAASCHPLGLVEEAFAFQNLQQSLASNVRLAAQRKMLPEVPAEWQAKVTYQTPQKTGSQTWSQSRSQSRAPIPSFVSPTRSPVSTPASHVGYRSLPRQWRPQKYMAEANQRPLASLSQSNRPSERQTYKSVYTSSTWSWRR